MVGLALVVLTVARCTSTTTSRNFKNTRLIIHRFWRVGALPGPHSKVVEGGEKGRLGFFLYWVEVWVPRVLQVHSLLVNLKRKRAIKV